MARGNSNKKKKNYDKKGPNGDYKSRDPRKSRQDRRHGADRDDANVPHSALNDVSWYTRYPELSVASASIPYPNKPGMRVPATMYLYP